MKKWMVGFIVIFGFFFAHTVCADPKHMKIYTKTPSVKYELIGEISQELSLLEYESSTVLQIGRMLQEQAAKLGANALITGKIEKSLKVTTEKEDYETDPFLETYYLSTVIRINATAIKIE